MPCVCPTGLCYGCSTKEATDTFFAEQIQLTLKNTGCFMLVN